eukprot:gene11115-13134_t
MPRTPPSEWATPEDVYNAETRELWIGAANLPPGLHGFLCQALEVPDLRFSNVNPLPLPAGAGAGAGKLSGIAAAFEFETTALGGELGAGLKAQLMLLRSPAPASASSEDSSPLAEGAFDGAALAMRVNGEEIGAWRRSEDPSAGGEGDLSPDSAGGRAAGFGDLPSLLSVLPVQQPEEATPEDADPGTAPFGPRDPVSWLQEVNLQRAVLLGTTHAFALPAPFGVLTGASAGSSIYDPGVSVGVKGTKPRGVAVQGNVTVDAGGHLARRLAVLTAEGLEAVAASPGMELELHLPLKLFIQFANPGPAPPRPPFPPQRHKGVYSSEWGGQEDVEQWQRGVVSQETVWQQPRADAAVIGVHAAPLHGGCSSEELEGGRCMEPHGTALLRLPGGTLFPGLSGAGPAPPQPEPLNVSLWSLDSAVNLSMSVHTAVSIPPPWRDPGLPPDAVPRRLRVHLQGWLEYDPVNDTVLQVTSLPPLPAFAPHPPEAPPAPPIPLAPGSRLTTADRRRKMEKENAQRRRLLSRKQKAIDARELQRHMHPGQPPPAPPLPVVTWWRLQMRGAVLPDSASLGFPWGLPFMRTELGDGDTVATALLNSTQGVLERTLRVEAPKALLELGRYSVLATPSRSMQTQEPISADMRLELFQTRPLPVDLGAAGAGEGARDSSALWPMGVMAWIGRNSLGGARDRQSVTAGELVRALAGRSIIPGVSDAPDAAPQNTPGLLDELLVPGDLEETQEDTSLVREASGWRVLRLQYLSHGEGAGREIAPPAGVWAPMTVNGTGWTVRGKAAPAAGGGMHTAMGALEGSGQVEWTGRYTGNATNSSTSARGLHIPPPPPALDGLAGDLQEKKRLAGGPIEAPLAPLAIEIRMPGPATADPQHPRGGGWVLDLSRGRAMLDVRLEGALVHVDGAALDMVPGAGLTFSGGASYDRRERSWHITGDLVDPRAAWPRPFGMTFLRPQRAKLAAVVVGLGLRSLGIEMEGVAQVWQGCGLAARVSVHGVNTLEKLRWCLNATLPDGHECRGLPGDGGRIAAPLGQLLEVVGRTASNGSGYAGAALGDLQGLHVAEMALLRVEPRCVSPDEGGWWNGTEYVVKRRTQPSDLEELGWTMRGALSVTAEAGRLEAMVRSLEGSLEGGHAPSGTPSGRGLLGEPEAAEEGAAPVPADGAGQVERAGMGNGEGSEAGGEGKERDVGGGSGTGVAGSDDAGADREAAQGEAGGERTRTVEEEAPAGGKNADSTDGDGANGDAGGELSEAKGDNGAEPVTVAREGPRDWGRHSFNLYISEEDAEASPPGAVLALVRPDADTAPLSLAGGRLRLHRAVLMFDVAGGAVASSVLNATLEAEVRGSTLSAEMGAKFDANRSEWLLQTVDAAEGVSPGSLAEMGWSWEDPFGLGLLEAEQASARVLVTERGVESLAADLRAKAWFTHQCFFNATVSAHAASGLPVSGGALCLEGELDAERDCPGMYVPAPPPREEWQKRQAQARQHRKDVKYSGNDHGIRMCKGVPCSSIAPPPPPDVGSLGEFLERLARAPGADRTEGNFTAHALLSGVQVPSARLWHRSAACREYDYTAAFADAAHSPPGWTLQGLAEPVHGGDLDAALAALEGGYGRPGGGVSAPHGPRHLNFTVNLEPGADGGARWVHLHYPEPMVLAEGVVELRDTAFNVPLEEGSPGADANLRANATLQ